MGGTPSVNYEAPETTAEMLKAYTEGLPSFMSAANAQILPNELAQLQASRETSPAYLELQKQLYDTYGADLNKIGSEIYKSNALAQAEADKAVIEGPGRDFVKGALETAKIADPEYFAAREKAGARLQELLQPGLTGGESEAAARGINRVAVGRGLLNAPSQTATLNAAQTFGNASRDRLSQALGVATGVMPQLRTGVNPFEVRPAQQNTGNNLFTGVRQESGNQAAGYSNNLLGQIGQNVRTETQANASNSNTALSLYRSPWQDAASMMSATGSLLGGVGGMGICHVAREVIPYDWQAFFFWKELIAPDWFRSLYDTYSIPVTRWLKNKPTIKRIVKHFMLNRINKLTTL